MPWNNGFTVGIRPYREWELLGIQLAGHWGGAEKMTEQGP